MKNIAEKSKKNLFKEPYFWSIFLVVCAFVVGYSMNNLAISDQNSNYRVAVIDLQKIVSNSSQVKTLRAEQEKKLSEMQTTIDKARHEISQEQDPAKIKALEDKYMNQINQQKVALDSEYNSKLTAIDNNIRSVVIEKARALNYDLVVPKGMVLFGGDDITDQISGSIK